MTDSLSEIPKGNPEVTGRFEVELPPCPQCGGVLELEFRFKTKLVCIAGSTIKLGATQWPYLVCECGFVEEGKMA